MAESLHAASEFIVKHKVALGVGGAAVVLWLILRGGGSSQASASGGGSALQIAQLQSARDLQMAQIQAGQNVATLGAQVQKNQNDDALQAHQDDLAASIAATAYSANVENTKTNAQATLYKDLIDTGAQEQLATLHVQEDLGAKAIALSGHENYRNTAANELALILGQGDINSFNSANASASIAGKLSSASIVKSIVGGASSALGGIFG